MKSESIDCAVHDYVETACLFHYEVRVTLAGGEHIEGRAETIKLRDDRTEVLILTTHEELKEVVLNEATRLEVLTPGARFDSVTF